MTGTPRPTNAGDPHCLEFACDEERLAALRADNAALQAMVRRLSLSASAPPAGTGGGGGGGGSSSSISISKAGGRTFTQDKQWAELHKKDAALVAERERRVHAESLLAEERTQASLAARKLECELARAHDQLLSVRGELAATRARLQEEEGLVGILKKENFRLLSALRAHSIAEPAKEAPPEYFTIGHAARAERIRRDVPSSKPFTTTIRSMSPNALAAQIFSPTKHKMTPRGAGAAAAPAVGPSQRGVGGSRSPSSNRRPNAGAGVVTPACGGPRPRSTSPGRGASGPAASTKGAGAGGMAAREFGLGSRVIWCGAQAVIKYIGVVHSFGDGTWFGLELTLPGRGDHDGSINGVRYFSAPTASGVFAQQHELRPSREHAAAPASAPKQQQQQPVAAAPQRAARMDPAPTLARGQLSGKGGNLGSAAPKSAPPRRVSPQRAARGSPKMAVEADVPAADVQPADAQPADVQPADVQPADAQPADAQPADAQPADVQPADAQPAADVQPADAQPAADVQPADAQPADA